MRKAVIAASRFGFGARPGDLEIISHHPEKWLLDQELPGQMNSMRMPPGS